MRIWIGIAAVVGFAVAVACCKVRGFSKFPEPLSRNQPDPTQVVVLGARLHPAQKIAAFSLQEHLAADWCGPTFSTNVPNPWLLRSVLLPGGDLWCFVAEFVLVVSDQANQQERVQRLIEQAEDFRTMQEQWQRQWLSEKQR
jgi:hypothetical protein